MDKNRLYGKFYLNDWKDDDLEDPSMECEKCDFTAEQCFGGQLDCPYFKSFIKTSRKVCEEKCELADDCERLADDLNDITYRMCCSEGVIKDTKYKFNHPLAYFKEITLEKDEK